MCSVGSLFMVCLRYGVMPATAKRVAACNTFGCQPAAFECAIFFYRFYGILRARRCITATGRQHRANGVLIKADEAEQ